jgi:hypothetical protein
MFCGEKRSTLRTYGLAADSGVNLFYPGRHSVQVRGASTGRSYQFTPVTPIQTVDQRDAVSLLQTKFFRRTR